MSVDYDAYFGIGYEVVACDEIKDTPKLEDGVSEYLYNETGKGFSTFQVGNAYTDDQTDTTVFLIIDNPFKNGLDLTSSKEKLDEEVKRLKLETRNNFGEVGGLYIC